MRVLIADDDATIREMLQHFIGTVGAFDIDIATNGINAIKLCRLKQYDLLIIDNYMPEKDGIDVLRDIKYDLSMAQTHVMFMTGRASKELVSLVRAEKIKIDDFIAKPFDHKKFREKVAAVYGKVRTRKRSDGTAISNPANLERRMSPRYNDPKLAVKTHLGVLRTINWSLSGLLLSYGGSVRFIVNSLIPAKIVAENRPPPFEATLSVVLDDPQRAVSVMKFVDLSSRATDYLKSLV